MTWPFFLALNLRHLTMFFRASENWKRRPRTAVSDVFVQIDLGRTHADVCLRARTVSHLLHRLLGMSSVSSKFMYGQTELNEKSEIINWPL